MARQNSPQVSARKDTITQITDSNGTIVVEFGLHEYTVRHSDGSRTHRRISQPMTTVDGTVLTHALMAKELVGICEQCRNGPPFGRNSHGIVLRKMARLCADGCGQLCCPRHIRRGRDGKWRCVAHHRRHLLKTLLRPIFFKQEDEL